MGSVDIERTPDGRRLVVARHVDAPRREAWELLTDTRRWPDWGPSVRDVDCETRYISEQTEGRIRVVSGLWLPFEIQTCREYRWTWRVARIPATGHRVDDRPDGCRVVFELPVLASGYAPVCLRALDKIEALLTAGESAAGEEM